MRNSTIVSKIYFGLILVHLIGNIDGLSCLMHKMTEIQNFTLTAGKDYVNKQIPVDGRKMCIAEIDFAYNDNSMRFDFGNTDLSGLTKINREVRIDTTIYLTYQSPLDLAIIRTVLHFECDSADECDRQFTIDHLDWLSKANYNRLASIFHSLIFTNNNKTG